MIKVSIKLPFTSRVTMIGELRPLQQLSINTGEGEERLEVGFRAGYGGGCVAAIVNAYISVIYLGEPMESD